MQKPVVFITFIIGVVIFLSIVQVVVSNNLSTTGVELSKLEKEISSYKKENTLLREKLLTMRSFTNIASKAAEMGFVEERERIFLKTQMPLAAKP